MSGKKRKMKFTKEEPAADDEDENEEMIDTSSRNPVGEAPKAGGKTKKRNFKFAGK